MIKDSRWGFVSAVLLLASTGCASIPTSKPLAPEVEVAGLEVIKLGLLSQELAFTLDVFNPNDYNLPVNTLNFIASIADQAVAKGSSRDPVLLSANSNTEVVINVTTSANKLLKKLIASTFSVDNALDYNVTGFVKLDNWPARIPFNVDKTLTLDGL